MGANIYTVRRGDTPGSIARALTGYAETWPYLIRANPQLRRRMTQYGPTFAPEDFVEGTRLFVPPMMLRGNVGQAGEMMRDTADAANEGIDELTSDGGGQTTYPKCTPPAVMEIKDYVYRLSSGEWISDVSKAWQMGDDWHPIVGANFDDPRGFVSQPGVGCRFKSEVMGGGDWGDGKLLRIPASWPPAPPGIVSRLRWYDPAKFSNNSAGQTIVPDPDPPNIPGQKPNIPPVDPDKPGKGGMSNVVAEEEESTGPSGALVVGLIGVAAVGAYALLSAISKRKRVPV